MSAPAWDIIARIETPFAEKFGVPRQSGIADSPGRIVFEKPFRDVDAVRSKEELPCTVQQLIIVAFFKLPGKCISPVIVRHEGSTRIFFIDRYNLHILPVRFVGCLFGHSACC